MTRKYSNYIGGKAHRIFVPAFLALSLSIPCLRNAGAALSQSMLRRCCKERTSERRRGIKQVEVNPYLQGHPHVKVSLLTVRGNWALKGEVLEIVLRNVFEEFDHRVVFDWADIPGNVTVDPYDLLLGNTAHWGILGSLGGLGLKTAEINIDRGDKKK